MVRLPPKKEPRMTRLSSTKGMKQEEIESRELEAEINGHADKVFYAIEEARRKMTTAQREKADKKADAILSEATAEERSRHRA